MASSRRISRYHKPQPQKIVPQDGDIHVLLAFANYVYRDERRERLTAHDAAHQPVAYRTRQPQRLSKALDSLANICVAQASGEVIATAFRLSNGETSSEIIIASNAAVPNDTIDYLNTIWGLLQEISVRIRGLPEYQSTTYSPSHKVDDENLLKLVEQVEIKSHHIQKRITSKVHKFQSIPVNDLSPQHPIHQVKQVIEFLDKALMRAEGGVLRPKPATDDNNTWEELHVALMVASEAIQTFLKGRDTGDWPFPLSRSLESYLRKVMSVMADVKVLTRMAVSPQCRGIFDRKPTINGLADQHRTIDSFPHSRDEWEEAIERPMAYYNQLPHVSSHRVMDMGVVSEDCSEIIKSPYPQSAPVHCEVKLLLHLFTEQHQSTNPKPAAFSYLGVSKLSCLGCFEFLSAFNEVLGTRFVIKGTHSKAYYPWAFPEGCAKHDQLLEQVYKRLTNHWVTSYNGYVTENVSLESDSTAQSDPTESGVVVEDDFKSGAENIMEKWHASN